MVSRSSQTAVPIRLVPELRLILYGSIEEYVGVDV